jgi:ribosome biogenesis GTPase
MAGRRLTQKQLAQVRRQQDKRVAAADEAEDAALGQPRDGLVVARFGKQADVEALDAPGMAVRCAIRANLESPVAGDRVVFRQGEAGAVIVAVLPRRTELRRPDNLGRIRTVAANIDDVLVVFAPLPSPSSDLLDRYLCACSIAGFRPRLLLNKADLAGPEDEATRWAIPCCAARRNRSTGSTPCARRSPGGPRSWWASPASANRRWSTRCCRTRSWPPPK